LHCGVIEEHYWEEGFKNNTIEEKTERFYKVIEEYIEQLGIPFKKIREVKQKIPRERRQLFKQKQVKLKQLKDGHLKDKIMKEINEKILESYNKERRTQEEIAVNKIKDNPKEFYKYVNSFRKSKEEIGPLYIDNKKISKHDEMAQVLSEQFEKAFSTPKQETKIQDPKTFSVEAY